MKQIFLYTLTGILTMSLVMGFTNTKKQVQSELPSIQLKDLEGNMVNIKDFASNGKLTVISFWATWCGPCIKELDNILELYDDWVADYEVELVAVSVDDSRNVPKVKPLVNGKGWPYYVLLDENKDLSRALNVQNPPMTFLIDKKGNIVYKHTGYTEGTEFELEKKIKEAAGK